MLLLLRLLWTQLELDCVCYCLRSSCCCCCYFISSCTLVFCLPPCLFPLFLPLPLLPGKLIMSFTLLLGSQFPSSFPFGVRLDRTWSAAIVDYDFLLLLFVFCVIHILFAAYSIRFTFGNDIISASCLYAKFDWRRSCLFLFFCLSLFVGDTTFPSATFFFVFFFFVTIGQSVRCAYLGWFCWPGGVGQIDMRIIDKLQSIDRSLDCRHSWKIEDCIAAGSGQGGVAAVAPPDSSRNYGIQIGTALGRTTLQLELGAGNWQLVTGNVQSATCSVQPVQHQLQLSLFLNGIIYTAVSQMPSAFSAMFTVVYFVVHLRRAHRIAHGALPQFPLTLSIPSIPFLAGKTTTEKDPHNHLQSPCRLQ